MWARVLLFACVVLPVSCSSPCTTAAPPTCTTFTCPAGWVNRLQAYNLQGTPSAKLCCLHPTTVTVEPTTAKPNMDAIIGGSVAGGVAVAAGIGAIIAWDQNRHDDDSSSTPFTTDAPTPVTTDAPTPFTTDAPTTEESPDACTPFTTEGTCPTPECEWTGTMCESPCTTFATQSTCLSPQCEWRGTSCQVPCTPFTTESTCPPSQCLWNATSSSCQAPCTDFTTMPTCTAAQCTWTGTLCGINGRVVIASNETAAASSSSASASNPWLWVGLALLVAGCAICIAALLCCFGQPNKKPKKSARKVVAPEPVVGGAAPEMVLPELAPLMSFATPVAAPVYQFAAPAPPVYQFAAPAPVTTTYVLR